MSIFFEKTRIFFQILAKKNNPDTKFQRLFRKNADIQKSKMVPAMAISTYPWARLGTGLHGSTTSPADFFFVKNAAFFVGKMHPSQYKTKAMNSPRGVYRLCTKF